MIPELSSVRLTSNLEALSQIIPPPQICRDRCIAKLRLLQMQAELNPQPNQPQVLGGAA